MKTLPKAALMFIVSLAILAAVLLLTDVPITYADNGVISGNVSDLDNNQPVSNLEISIWYFDQNLAYSEFSTCTASDGTYSFSGLPLNVNIYVNTSVRNWSGNCSSYYSTYLEAYYTSSGNTWDYRAAEALILTADTPAATNVNFEMDKGGTISGIVTDNVTTNPIASVWVNASTTDDLDYPSWTNYSCTNSNGSYSIPRVPRGVGINLWIIAKYDSCDGTLKKYESEWYNNRTDRNLADPIILNGINPTLQINMALTPLNANGSISGTVTYGANPVAGIEVLIYPITINRNDSKFDLYAQKVCTDAFGDYAFTELITNESYWLEVNGEKGCSGSHFFNEYKRPVPVAVTTGVPTVTGIDFAMTLKSPYSSISGYVTDSLDFAVQGIRVYAVRKLYNASTSSYDIAWEGTACTDSSGYYQFPSTPLGNYEFQVYVDGYGGCGGFGPFDYAEEYYGGWHNGNGYWVSTSKYSLVDFTYVPSPATNINFVLNEYGTVSGNISSLATSSAASMPLDSIKIWGYSAETGWNQYNCADSSGNYTLWIPEDTVVNVYVLGSHDNDCSDSVSYDYTDLSAGTFTLDVFSSSVTGVDFVLAPRKRIFGTVVGNYTPYGTYLPSALENVDVFVSNSDGSWAYYVCTNEDGEYQFDNVLGDTNLYVWSTGETRHCSDDGTLQPGFRFFTEYWQETDQGANASPIVLTNDVVTAENIDLTLNEVVGTIQGRVVDSTTGAGIPNVQVWSHFGREWYSVCSDSNGNYSLTQILLNANTVVTAGGTYNTCTNGSDTYTEQWWQNVATDNNASLVVVTDAEVPITGVNFTLTETNLPPIVTAPLDFVTNEGETVSFDILASDPENDRLTFSATNLPPGISINPNGGTIFGTVELTAFDNSPYIVTVTVAEDHAPVRTVIASFVWTVQDLTAQPAPVNLEARNLDTLPLKPEFRWAHLGLDGDISKVPGDWYAVTLSLAGSGPIINEEWYPSEEICDGLVCAVTSQTELYAEGDYSLQVEVYYYETNSVNVSLPLSFEINFEPPAIPVVSVDMSSGRPVLSFPDDPFAAWYQVEIKNTATDQVLSQYLSGSTNPWYQKTSEICNGITCTLTPYAHPVNGSYTVRMQAWSPGGFNGSDEEAWSEEVSFIVSFAPPGLVQPLTTTNVDLGYPTFTWQGAAGATWYNFRVMTAPTQANPNGTQRHNRWYSAVELGCAGGGICTLELKYSAFANGDYVSAVQAWGPGGLSLAGNNGWTDNVAFTVDAPLPASIPQPLTPTGDTYTGKPTFTWNHVDGVTWYFIGVKSTNPTFPADIQEWRRAVDVGCLDNNICELTLDQYLLITEYDWFIIYYGPAMANISQPSDLIRFNVLQR